MPRRLPTAEPAAPRLWSLAARALEHTGVMRRAWSSTHSHTRTCTQRTHTRPAQYAHGRHDAGATEVPYATLPLHGRSGCVVYIQEKESGESGGAARAHMDTVGSRRRHCARHLNYATRFSADGHTRRRYNMLYVFRGDTCRSGVARDRKTKPAAVAIAAGQVEASRRAQSRRTSRQPLYAI